MSKNSKLITSPDRHTFQLEGHIRRCEEKGEEPTPGYLDYWETQKEADARKEADPEWQKNNMEYDLRTTQWIIDKVQTDETYAQNLYAAMCNNEFIKLELFQVLKDERWSCSWRYAGGIVAHMRGEGDYIDWYCSGIRDIDMVPEGTDCRKEVPESTVTDEIRADLHKLGWIVVEQ